MELTEQKFWSMAQQELSQSISKDDPVYLWLNGCFNFSNIKDCMEIGCYPGRFLHIFGEKGVIINGIDYLEEIKYLTEYFKQFHYNVGKFYHKDFILFNSQEKFDCICSFGFIEHFTNWQDILLKHTELLNQNGYLIIEVPNFRGLFQRIPRFLFDHTLFKAHNLDVMRLSKLMEFCEHNKLKIVDARYFGGYQLWFHKQYTNTFIRFTKRVIIVLIRRIIKYFFTENHPSFSCCIGIIAKKEHV